MNTRQVFCAWLIGGGLLLASFLMSRALAPTPAAFHNAATAVIGSSQTRYAVPRNGGGPSSLGSHGEAFWRYGVSAITEPETIELANRALDEKADLIIIEVNALVFDNEQTADRGRCDQPARQFLISLKSAQLAITSSWINAFSRNGQFDDGGEATNFQNPGVIDPVKSRKQIPSVLRGPCNKAALIRLATRAKRQGSKLLFMAPPRSVTANQLLGAERSRAIDQLEKNLSSELGVTLFAPASPWPDSLFISVGHLDVAGRARFINELRQFLREQG